MSINNSKVLKMEIIEEDGNIITIKKYNDANKLISTSTRVINDDKYDILFECEYYESGNLKSSIDYRCKSLFWRILSFGYSKYWQGDHKIITEYFDKNPQFHTIKSTKRYRVKNEGGRCDLLDGYCIEYYESGNVKTSQHFFGINEYIDGYHFWRDKSGPKYTYYDNSNNSLKIVEDKNITIKYDENNKIINKTFIIDGKCIGVNNAN